MIVVKWTECLMRDTFLQQLTSSQREAVCHIEGPLLVLAGPGSGKTRVITCRIAALIDSGIQPYNICAITFTNKAADEMRQRVSAFGLRAGAYVSTFHSLCVRLLRQYADKANIKSNFSIYDQSDQRRCMRRAIKDCELDGKNFPPSRMLEAVSTLKNKLISVESFNTDADDFFAKTLARVYDCYQRILTEHDALDFDDLLMKTAVLLESCPDVCCEVGNRFKFLLVDEYQDTNHAQYKIAKALVTGHNNICVTGDPDQSIYRWRGADIRNILAFERDWPDAVVVKLEENFRSTANILKAADRLIAFNQSRKEKKLISTKPTGKDVVVSNYENDLEESRDIARQTGELVAKGVSLSDIAIFYRVNAMSRAVEEAFIENKIPYQIVRGVEFYRRKEVRDILAFLKVLVNPSDEIALLRIINTPARGIGKTTIDKIRAYAVSNNITFFEGLKKAGYIESLSKAMKAKIALFVNMIEGFRKDAEGSVAQLAERVFVESGLQKLFQGSGDDGKIALENVKELIGAAVRYDRQTEQPSLVDYLQQISLFSDADVYDSCCERVALMSLHAAKGLEFENVFILGLEEGLLPHERSSDNEDETEEERRLFFVGITRAKRELNISYCRYRTVRGQLLRTIPSQFLYELGYDLSEVNRERRCCYDDADVVKDCNLESNIQGSGFEKGQLVRHEIFGLGRVRKFVDMGESSVVTVKFNMGQTKTLMLKYANLIKI